MLLFPTFANRLATELNINERLLQQARVHLETCRHELRMAESLVAMYVERTDRQNNELMVLQYQDDLKRIVGDKHDKPVAA